MKYLVPLMLGFLLMCAFKQATGRELYPDQYAQVSPRIQQWFKAQRTPQGTSCCDEADGGEVEEDIRDGKYWIKSHSFQMDWIQVPDEVIIRTANLYGRPVAWFLFNPDHTVRGIRCYAPGPLL